MKFLRKITSRILERDLNHLKSPSIGGSFIKSPHNFSFKQLELSSSSSSSIRFNQKRCYLTKNGGLEYNNSRSAADAAIAFDIDGVLLKGKKVLPETHRALNKLIERKIPFILLTNGGGRTEEDKAKELSGKFQVPIDPIQVVLAHRNDPILVIGKDECKNVALNYGFQKVFTCDEIMSTFPSMWPFKELDLSKFPKIDLSEPFKAIMVFHDSRDWGRDAQIATDLLRSDKGKIGTLSPKGSSQSNGDFLWSNDYPINRFAQGAFNYTLKVLYEKLTDQELKYVQYGKPEHVTYKYAVEAIQNQSKKLGQTRTIKRIFAIGDNPASDIHGANAHGWTSVLVRTGVWQEHIHGSYHQATHVVDHVDEAVDWILGSL